MFEYTVVLTEEEIDGLIEAVDCAASEGQAEQSAINGAEKLIEISGKDRHLWWW